MKYAKVIVDISLAKLDRTFTYSIPEEMRDSVRPGVRVTVPFGSRRLSGYVLELIEEPDYEADKIKAIAAVENGYAELESVMVRLARWMKAEYGCTFYQFVNRYRVEEAKRLKLANPDLKMDEVAARCGFSSRTVFSNVFTREEGVSPREWYKKCNPA
jgi:primosomal protein N' (replication factor Y)